MDNQHKKIKGYRELEQHEIDLMNEAKELAEKCGELIYQMEMSFNGDVKTDIDQRWLATAKTDLQKGFMSLVRSIARPTTF